MLFADISQTDRKKKCNHSQTCLNILLVQSCTNINGFTEMGSYTCKWIHRNGFTEMIPNSNCKYEFCIIFEGWNKIVILQRRAVTSKHFYDNDL